MKKHRLAAAGLALALAAGSVAIAGPALAADVYVAGDITATEGASYPAGWFAGTITPASATPTGSDAGLNVTGATQLLYGGDIVITTGAQLQALLDGANLATGAGSATFQIPMFFNSEDSEGLEFTTLRPTNAGTPGGTWTTSRAFGIFAAGDTFTSAELAEFADAAIGEGGWVPKVLAFGVFVDAGVQTVLQSVTFNGNTYFFTKQPAAPVADPVKKPAAFTG